MARVEWLKKFFTMKEEFMALEKIKQIKDSSSANAEAVMDDVRQTAAEALEEIKERGAEKIAELEKRGKAKLDQLLAQGEAKSAGKKPQMANERQVDGQHYKRLSIEPWAAMEAWMTNEEFVGFLKGNIIKYLAREKNANDLDKAGHYMQKLLEVRVMGATKELGDVNTPDASTINFGRGH